MSLLLTRTDLLKRLFCEDFLLSRRWRLNAFPLFIFPVAVNLNLLEAAFLDFIFGMTYLSFFYLGDTIRIMLRPSKL